MLQTQNAVFGFQICPEPNAVIKRNADKFSEQKKEGINWAKQEDEEFSWQLLVTLPTFLSPPKYYFYNLNHFFSPI